MNRMKALSSAIELYELGLNNTRAGRVAAYQAVDKARGRGFLIMRRPNVRNHHMFNGTTSTLYEGSRIMVIVYIFNVDLHT